MLYLRSNEGSKLQKNEKSETIMQWSASPKIFYVSPGWSSTHRLFSLKVNGDPVSGVWPVLTSVLHATSPSGFVQS